MHRLVTALSAAVFLVPLWISLLLGAPPAAGETPPSEKNKFLDPVAEVLAAAQFRHVGPVGNRVPAVVGVPGDPNTYLAGAASGGVWKSTDGGHSWRPTFDNTGAHSIGALAVAPSDANVVWAGTGEAFLRSNISIGNGVLSVRRRGRVVAAARPRGHRTYLPHRRRPG